MVATLDDGTFVIAWVDGTTVRLAVRHPGDASFTTTTVPGLGSVHNLALAAAPGGGAALAITDLLNGQGRLMLSIAPAGGSFGTPSVAATVDAAADYELQGVGLAYGAGGKLGVGFVEHHNGAGELYGLTGDANGAVGFASPIPGTTWTSLSDVQVSFASDGTEAIAYQGVQGAVPKGRLAVASPGGAWSTVPAWPAGVDPGAVRVASVGSQLVALSGSSGDGLAGGVVPNLASQGTAVPGSVDVVDSIAAHGADAVATVMHKADGAYHVEAFTWDGTPPVISDLTAPASAIAGVAAPFHASASDALSAASVRWSFGDGETATGDNAMHAFATAGTFTVTATATDGAGNTTTRSADVSVATPAPPAATKLQFLSAKVNRAHTAVRWTLNLPASVSATIKRGTRVVSVTKHRAGTAGSAGVRRSHGRPLRRGRYRIVLRARDTSGLAATRTIKLRVR